MSASLNENPYRLISGESVFSLSGKARRLSIDAQQRRAAHLVELLHRERALEDREVLVVGAGVAGLTFAVSASLLGAATVRVVDKAPMLMGNLRSANHRLIHPAMLEWPARGWDRPVAWSPVLRWHAMRADRLWDHLAASWEEWVAHLGPIRLPPPLLRTTVRLARREPGWSVALLRDRRTDADDATAEPALRADLVVIAMGPGHERFVEHGQPPLRYWDQDLRALDGHHGTEEVLIVGDGDGALIDCVRHAVLDESSHGLVDHGDIFRLMYTSGAGNARQEPLDASASARIDHWVRQARRSPYRVTVATQGGIANGPANGFHKLLATKLVGSGHVREIRTRVTPKQEPGSGSGEPWSRVIYRIGPDASREVADVFHAWAGPPIDPVFALHTPGRSACRRAIRLLRRAVRRSRRAPEPLIWDRSEWHVRAGDLWVLLHQEVRHGHLDGRRGATSPATDVSEIAHRWRALLPQVATLGVRGRASRAEINVLHQSLSTALRWLVPLGAWVRRFRDELGGERDLLAFARWLDAVAPERERTPEWLCGARKGVLLPPSPGASLPVHLPWLRREELRWSTRTWVLSPDLRVKGEPCTGDRWEVVDHVAVAPGGIRQVRELRPPAHADLRRLQQLVSCLSEDARPIWIPGERRGYAGLAARRVWNPDQLFDPLPIDARLAGRLADATADWYR